MSNDIDVLATLTRRFFAFFDNRDGRTPHERDFEALFLPGAAIVTHGDAEPALCSPADFVRPRVALLTSGRLVNFHEWETESATDVLGTLAVRRSRYAKSGVLEGAAYAGTGTKYFQFAKVRGAWRIVAVSWRDDGTHGG